MKTNKSKLYAKALAEIIIEKKAEGPERSRRTAENFVKLLDKNGQMHRAKEILNLAEDFLLARQGKNKITFETARKMTSAQKKMLEGFAKSGDNVQEKINSELIAGIKIIINNNKQFDASLRKKLENIF